MSIEPGAKMLDIFVVKCNPDGKETWRYPGRVVWQTTSAVLIEAWFNRSEVDVHGMMFRQGDRFIELYYSDRWYNIFEVYEGKNGPVKGWYCNVSFPAEFIDGSVVYRDLALDLLVFPDGRQLLLDEDEFSDLVLDPLTARKAWAAVDELKSLFKNAIEFSLIKYINQDQK